MQRPGVQPIHRAGRAAGFSLLEALMVVLIVALLARAALPSLAPALHVTLDAATGEVLEALRFARSEAQRTNAPHGVRFDTGIGTSRLRVFRYLQDATPAQESYTVLHPVERQLYSLPFAARAPLAGASIASAAFVAATATDPGAVAFDGRGAPVLTQGATLLPLTSGSVTVEAAQATRVVTIDAVTGRVAAP